MPPMRAPSISDCDVAGITLEADAPVGTMSADVVARVGLDVVLELVAFVVKGIDPVAVADGGRGVCNGVGLCVDIGVGEGVGPGVRGVGAGCESGVVVNGSATSLQCSGLGEPPTRQVVEQKPLSEIQPTRL